MEDGLTFTRETIKIEGDRNLYSYTFRQATGLERLVAMIESGETEGVGDFLDRHPELDLDAALESAREHGCEEAARELQDRIARDLPGP